MTESPLFPRLKGFVHGGDYNPDQWLDRPDILQQDIALMKKARINCVTLGVFAWAALEPREGEYHFEWMEEIIDRLYANGIHTILATPSGARPAWLDEKYPDAMRVDAYGIPNRHGMRHNHCPSSENYRRLVRQMDTHLAERFARHPGVLMWHIGNEFGGYCYCEKCKKKFQNYLRDQFGDDIQRLNSAWWAAFWSHSYNSFEQIEPPYSNGENSVLALLLEWNRFTTWNTMDFIQNEIDALRPFNPALPVTTNFMDLFPELDYHKMAPQLDAVSWDSYPRFHNDYETLSDTFLNCAFNHALFRSMKKDRPFLLMESAPGLVNWNPVNKYRRPGIHKLAGLQAVACGSDSVQYFQIRKSRGSFEQHHGAVIDHVGTSDTRIFREVEELGQVLENIREVAGTLADNKIAVVFDWNCRWAVKDARALADDTKNYEETCRSLWRELVKIGLEPDIVPADGKWDGYKIVIAPMMYITSEETGKRIAQYVADGGVLIGTYFSAYVDENLLCHLGGFPGAGLKDVFGLVSEEIDTFYPSDRNHIQWLGRQVPFEVRDYAELIRLHGARALAYYTEDYVKGEAAVTRHTYGKGTAYYLACRVDPARLRPFFASVAYDQGLTPKSLPEGV
ncbi:MAG: beta-galactosidase, partial [Oscillospiraceae bacterium]|nr:beta-galactosidase [Oscillospiraceae bacterium]